MQKLIPTLYRLTAISAHDSITEIFTDDGVASDRESELWDGGGIASISIDYADEAIDGYRKHTENPVLSRRG